jgi:hypothetical protein
VSRAQWNSNPAPEPLGHLGLVLVILSNIKY